MATTQPPQVSSRVITMVFSVAGLAVVWGVVWANMPTKEELKTVEGPSPVAETAAPSVLDLAIPGVPPAGRQKSAPPSRTVVVNGVELPKAGTGTPEFTGPLDPRAKQIVEMKCDVEVERVCPESLQGEDRRSCLEQRSKQLSPPCRQILRQRLVRWKESSGQALACIEDVKRLCREVQPGEGRVLHCLQNHAQEVSEQCYATLPKGSLTYRN